MTAVNGGHEMATRDPSGRRIKFKKLLDVHETSQDFMQNFEGMGSQYPIHCIEDTSKGDGHEITFTSKAAFHRLPVRSDERIAGRFETINTGSYKLRVDTVKHGTEITRLTEEEMGIRGLLANGIPQAQAEWMGRLKNDEVLFMLLHRGTYKNNQFAGKARSINQLRPEDELDHNLILQGGRGMQRAGATPAKLSTPGSRVAPAMGYCTIATTDSLLSLESDASYNRAVTDALPRSEKAQFMFRNDFQAVRGNTIHPYTPIDAHDGDGAVGSVLSPKAWLKNELTNPTTGDKVQGGGSFYDYNVDQGYMRYFPNFAYTMVSGPNGYSLPVIGEDFYFLIKNSVDSSPGAGDAGKWGIFSYQENDGGSLTIKEALSDGNDVGNVTWDPTQNTTNFHPDAEIVWCNSSAVPVQYTIMLGACAARRGKGKLDKQFDRDTQEGHFNEYYIASTFGQEPRFDAVGQARGYIKIAHAVSLQDFDIAPALIDENYWM